ncbi:hopanoid-associated phosphorylase [Nitrosomonas sp. PY1]|uniref:phosphorylase family protein n=1 Tax=Nitrosomonas sp. PY1 TaxID=1803906 RepID=UPI001FC88ACD|nr:phosphorylase [Nitrosomonas sp. PY1]GKS69691.1 hopanoid-associated phosphorylase [Nitrosomonas sp. PY1]
MDITGLVVALRAEARCVTSLPIPMNKKIVINQHTMLWLSGMGAESARKAAKQLCDAGVTRLVSFGVAGALDAQLKPGDLVLPDAVYGENLLPVALDWRNHLQHRLSSNTVIVNGVLVNSVEPLTTMESKLNLAEITGACAVDMESSAVATVAADAAIPFIAVRAIVDPVEFSPPGALLNAVKPDGSANLFRVLTLVLNRSIPIGTLLQMGLGMRAACKTLSRVIQAAGPDLAS